MLRGMGRSGLTAGVPFDLLAESDLLVEQLYRGGSRGNVGDDALARLLPVGLLGGFRYQGSPTRGQVRLVVPYSSLREPDWPDELDPRTGIFTYYGDNRSPGRDLHDTPRRGNQILTTTLELARAGSDSRKQVPPYFLFSKAGTGRDVVFRRRFAPGAAQLATDEELGTGQSRSRARGQSADLPGSDTAGSASWYDVSRALPGVHRGS
jgi:hypothetical protein